jgi:hypothetical protein
MIVSGAIALGGGYAFNLLISPLYALQPPDGTGQGSSVWWLLVPVAGPFVVGAQTTNNNLGFRRVEYVDGAFQLAGAALIAAGYLFPEQTQVKTATATMHPVVSPRFVGMGGTF